MGALLTYDNSYFSQALSTSRGRGFAENDPEESDEGLVEKARSGDQQAFVELSHRSRRSLQRTILRIVRNHDDAEDILQETLLKAYIHLARFRGRCRFQTWISRIAINTALMLLRKRKTKPETSLAVVTAEGVEIDTWEVPDTAPNPEQVYAKWQTSQIVTDAVRRLPARSRQLVEFYHEDGVKLADAASAMGITQAAAKSRLLRARTVLRRRLKNHGSRYVDQAIEYETAETPRGHALRIAQPVSSFNS